MEVDYNGKGSRSELEEKFEKLVVLLIKMEKELIQKFYKYNLEKKQSEKVESYLLFSTFTKDRHCFSFVGAGGKSSLIEIMAAGEPSRGKRYW